MIVVSFLLHYMQLRVSVVESLSLSLPRLVPLQDTPAFAEAHEFSRTSNWLIPGHLMCGHYPGACPSRQNSDEEITKNLALIRDAGVCTFVCLQDELPPQDADWPDDGIEKKSERAPWAKGNFKNYRKFMPMTYENPATYVHYKLPDLSVAKTLNDLDEIVSYLVERIKNGNKIYIHCWGGRGRTGLISTCILGALYNEIDAEEALDRVQTAYSLREPWRKSLSPETEEQRSQVRDWFSYKRTTKVALSPLAEDNNPNPRPQAFGIWCKEGTRILEIVSPTNNYPIDDQNVNRSENNADKLGNGRFGQVFRGRCETSPDHNPVAIKVTYYIEDAPTHQQSKLALEAKVLRAMSGFKGFPKVLYDARQLVFGRPSDVLVMQLLGRPILKRCWDKDRGDALCKERSVTEAGVMKIGRDVMECLRHLHEEGFTHNDLKPNNMLFGTQGSGTENDVHLVDFGMVTKIGYYQDEEVEGCELQAGGSTPLFASLAHLDGRPTRPVDDVESLWYCLAYLVQKELPWQWEPVENLRNIKRQLFIDECGISSDECSALLSCEDCCSTQHCLDTYKEFDVPDTLHGLWYYVLEGNRNEDGMVDYDGCLEALGDQSRVEKCFNNGSTQIL